MEYILINAQKYENLAKRYEFDKNKWDKEKTQCLKEMIAALLTFASEKNYAIEFNPGAEPCININPDSENGRVRKRTAGIYAAPTKGYATLYLNANTYHALCSRYELPECKFKNNQYYCVLSFCELCSFVEAIISL